MMLSQDYGGPAPKPRAPQRLPSPNLTPIEPVIALTQRTFSATVPHITHPNNLNTSLSCTLIFNSPKDAAGQYIYYHNKSKI